MKEKVELLNLYICKFLKAEKEEIETE